MPVSGELKGAWSLSESETLLLSSGVLYIYNTKSGLVSVCDNLEENPVSVSRVSGSLFSIVTQSGKLIDYDIKNKSITQQSSPDDLTHVSNTSNATCLVDVRGQVHVKGAPPEVGLAYF